MRDSIQNLLNELSNQNDSRTSVFDVQVEALEDAKLSLSGSLLNGNQLSDLQESIRRQFPALKLDVSSIRILEHPGLPCCHVATNLTGLYDKPTLHLPFSSELCYGTKVKILDEKDKWALTQQKDGYLGWVYRSHLTEGAAIAATHLVIAPSCELRAKPDSTSEIVTRLVSGSLVALEETQGDWARVTANKNGWLPSSLLRAVGELPKSSEERRKLLIGDSARMIGVPYVWGGISGNGIDCSGLARLLHTWVGLDIARDADMQHLAAKPVEPPFEVGDLLFFREAGKKRLVTHVGISLGGWRMIHSSQGNNGVYIDDVQQRKSLMDIFVSAGSFLRDA